MFIPSMLVDGEPDAAGKWDEATDAKILVIRIKYMRLGSSYDVAGVIAIKEVFGEALVDDYID